MRKIVIIIYNTQYHFLFLVTRFAARLKGRLFVSFALSIN